MKIHPDVMVNPLTFSPVLWGASAIVPHYGAIFFFSPCGGDGDPALFFSQSSCALP
jgi:hypothetical protein